MSELDTAQWQYPACDACQTYGIERVRTQRGYALWRELCRLYPKRPPAAILQDIATQMEAKLVGCEHHLAEGGWLQHLPPSERRAAGIRASIRVWTRLKPCLDPETSAVLANSSAW